MLTSNSVFNYGTSAIAPLFNGPEVPCSASDKVTSIPQTFSNNSDLDDTGNPLPAFLFRTNLKRHNIPIL